MPTLYGRDRAAAEAHADRAATDDAVRRAAQRIRTQRDDLLATLGVPVPRDGQDRGQA